MDVKKKQCLLMSLLLSTLMISTGQTTQQSVLKHFLGRDVDPSTASALVNDHGKYLEYKKNVQPLSDMSPAEYIAVKERKPHAPISELIIDHGGRKELSRLNVIVSSTDHEEAASHLVSLGQKGFDVLYLESVIELQTDPLKTGLMDKKPSPARIEAKAYFKKVVRQPSERELNVMAYIVDPEEVKIKEPKPEEFQAALYLMDLIAPIIAKPTAGEMRAAAFLMGGPIAKPSPTEVKAAAYLMTGPIPKPTSGEVLAAEALLAGPIIKPDAEQVRASEELMIMRIHPTAATVKAILYLPTIKVVYKGASEIILATAYLVDSADTVIEKPTPDEILATETLFDRVKTLPKPTAGEVRAMEYFMNKGILPAPTVFEIRAAAYLIDVHSPVIKKPKLEEIKATEYLQNTFRMHPISKPNADQVQAATYLQTTSLGKMGGVLAAKPTPDQVNATVALWTSQFGATPYPKADMREIDAVAKGTTETQKSLIAWHIQNTGGDIPGGVAELIKTEHKWGYQYFRFIPVGFDVMASKAAACLFNAEGYGITGSDGFRVSNSYPTGLKDGEQFVFETLIPDKARTDSVFVTGIAKPK